MKSRINLALTLAALTILRFGYAAEHSIEKPNIVIILADDLGYGDVGFNGSSKIKTPYLDRMAENGLVFTDFHSNGSVCSPTRAALLTGRYQHRSGVCNVLGQTGNAMKKVYPDKPFTGLDPDELTIAEVMKANGYRTAMFGKWHLGVMETQGPNAQGFEYFRGCDGNMYDYFTYFLDGKIEHRTADRVRADESETGVYYTYKLADEFSAFVEGNKEQPFFAYVPFTAPHTPYWGPNDSHLKLTRKVEFGHGKGANWGPRDDRGQAYREMVEALDDAIGRILATLKKRGLEKNTLVFFTSDNGPSSYGSAGPYRGGKGSVYDGGHRVPAIAYWPGRISQGISHEPAMTMDLFPTVVSICDAAVPPDHQLDGVDLSRHIFQREPLEERFLYWEKPITVWMQFFNRRQAAVRKGNWKWIHRYNQEPELYYLSADPSESNNLAAQYPEKVEEFSKKFAAWKTQVYQNAPYDLETFIKKMDQMGMLDHETDL